MVLSHPREPLKLRTVLPVLIMLWALVMAQETLAHLAGITDTSVQLGASQVKVIYTLPTDSVNELSSRSAAGEDSTVIQQEVAAGFVISNNGSGCQLSESSTRLLAQVQSQQFVLLYDCQSPLDVVEIEYRLFVDRFADHENFVRIAMAGKYISRVFNSAEHRVQLPVADTLKNWGVTLSNNFVDDPNSTLQLSVQPNYFPLGVNIFCLALIICCFCLHCCCCH